MSDWSHVRAWRFSATGEIFTTEKTRLPLEETLPTQRRRPALTENVPILPFE